MYKPARIYLFFFFNDTATTEIYTLSLHDALPISASSAVWCKADSAASVSPMSSSFSPKYFWVMAQSRLMQLRSEEHTSELQSRSDLVCRLLLEKKKKKL